jgi:hypothetical protein
MKNKILLPGIFVLASCFACKKDKRIPDCIDQKIDEFKHTTSCSFGTNVKEYNFQSSRVFVFDPGNCGADMTSEVLDENCNTLGYLGGFAGNTKINGEDFDNAKLVRTIWFR